MGESAAGGGRDHDAAVREGVAPASRAGASSPHARFPWAPAMLCAASLAMAAWTWMRYSYCRDIALRELPSLPEGIHLGPAPYFCTDPAKRALESSLMTTWPETVAKHRLRETYVRVRGCATSVSDLVNTVDANGVARAAGSRGVWVSDGTGKVEVLLSPSHGKPYRVGDDVAFRGRLVLGDTWFWDSPPFALDTTAGRLHPASAGGLVVGAMGAFVFALYLRSWLRERRAP